MEVSILFYMTMVTMMMMIVATNGWCLYSLDLPSFSSSSSSLDTARVYNWDVKQRRVARTQTAAA
jgi:hypothetical protein